MKLSYFKPKEASSHQSEAVIVAGLPGLIGCDKSGRWVTRFTVNSGTVVANLIRTPWRVHSEFTIIHLIWRQSTIYERIMKVGLH